MVPPGIGGLTAPGDPHDWCRKPVTMPDGWDGIHVERLWVRGREAELTAIHGDQATLDVA